MSKGSAIVGFLLCFMGGMVLMWGIDKYGGPGTASDVTKEGEATEGAARGGAAWSYADAKVPISSADPGWGSPEAPVTLVLFSDYQCPFCSRVEPTLKGLKDKYGKDKLHIVWKDFPLPFHQNAMPAAIAAQTVFDIAGNDAFWKFHEVAFENQGNLTPANFEAWAVQAGADKAKFAAAFAAQKAKAKVDKDMADGKAAGVQGTPASFINGVFVSGAQPQQAFEAEIDKQLKEAEGLIAAGTPKNKIYTTLTNRNHAQKAAPEPAKEHEKKPAEDKTVWRVPVDKEDPVKGNPNAPVTIVEFSDFQCPFCSRVGPTLKQIFDSYPDKVRLVWKDQPLPFHNRALPASILAREAKAQKGNKGFWEAHDLLFENQGKLEDENLWDYAQKLGLDVAKVKAAVSGNKYKALIDACQELANDMNASGTPHFFINGRRIAGAQPFENFKQIIDEELPKAEALLKNGIAPKDLYAEVIKDGKGPPPPERKDAGPAPKGAPEKGAKNAQVVIQEFSDFQCPFCSRVTATVDQVVKDYGTKVKVVWRHKPLPFHQDAPLAHQAAMEAFAQKGNKGFWAMHDKLFAGQSEPGLKREQLDKYAQEIGLDLAKFKKALDAGTHKEGIDQDAAAADKIGIGGTPAFVIGGYFLSGAQPYAKFKKLVELALKEAK